MKIWQELRKMESIDPNPPEVEKEIPNQPEIVVEKVSINYRKFSKEELPESLDDFAWYPMAYGYFRKLDKGKYANPYPTQYFFHQFLKEMYRRARVQGQISYYDYQGNITVDFPIENTENRVRLYASFIPNKKSSQPWYCWGIRKGGKIADFAILGNIETDYRQAQKMTDLDAAGIGSQFAFRNYLEDKFIEAIAFGNIYRYVKRDRIYYEYPLDLFSSSKNQIITATFTSANDSSKWRFVRLSYHDISHPLDEQIRRDESRKWRKEERQSIKKERDQREAELKEAEWKKREAEKNLIAFEMFPLRKVSNTVAGYYRNRLERFAFLNEKIYRFDKERGIDLRDSDVIIDAVSKAFAACNPFDDIDYYEDSGKKSAELLVKFPGYEDKIIYAHFIPNLVRNMQPWHLDILVDGTIFQRTFRGVDCSKLYGKYCHVTGEQPFESADEFAAYVEQVFMTGITNGSLYYYGEPGKKRIELPLSVPGSDPVIHLVFKQTTDRKKKWAFAGFRKRFGDDVRFCISDEYKKELEEKPAESDSDAVEEEESVVIKQVVAKREEPKFQGTAFYDVDGKPISLANFCKRISFRKLRQLADMAEEEKWGWRNEEPLELLYKYLNIRFVRLGYERKIGHARNINDLDYVVFHTGLFSKEFHEPIYACLKPVPEFTLEYAGPKWFLDGFCYHSEGGDIYEKMREKFPIRPPDVSFMHASDGTFVGISLYQMDLSQNIELKEEHILKERGYRLPHKFLERAFRACKDPVALQHLQKLTSLQDELEQKEFWLNEFSVYLENTPATYDKLLQLLGYAVEEAVRCNVRHPIPAYYPRDNTLNWLLPLRFYEETDLKNLVLVVGLREAGGYKGITIMTLEMVYHHIRAFANPDSYWLKTEILDKYVIDEWAYNKAEETDEEYNEL